MPYTDYTAELGTGCQTYRLFRGAMLSQQHDSGKGVGYNG